MPSARTSNRRRIGRQVRPSLADRKPVELVEMCDLERLHDAGSVSGTSRCTSGWSRIDSRSSSVAMYWRKPSWSSIARVRAATAASVLPSRASAHARL